MDTRAPTLLEVQRALQDAVLRATAASAAPHRSLPRLRELPRGHHDERIGVYVNGYPARLTESLAETFPATAHLTGGERFEACARRYIAMKRPTSFNLNDAGAAFPDFVVTDPLQTEMPFVADLARLERLVAVAFHSFEQAPFDPTSLADWSGEDWDGATLRFQPSVAVVRSDWPVHDLWQARETEHDDIDIQLEDAGQSVVIYRRGLDVRCALVPDIEARALSLLQEGEPLGRVLEAVAAAGGDPDAAGTWFSTWAAAGMITACERGDTHP